MIYELQRQLEALRLKSRRLEAENIKLREDVRRWENARHVWGAEISHYQTKLYGPNTHPDADVFCGCKECAGSNVTTSG
jgi:hypothetical protein